MRNRITRRQWREIREFAAGTALILISLGILGLWAWSHYARCGV